jgi:hypothetical protein
MPAKESLKAVEAIRRKQKKKARPGIGLKIAEAVIVPLPLERKK